MSGERQNNTHGLYLSSVPSTGRVWHKIRAQGRSHAKHFQKFRGLRRYSPKEGRLRCQAINLTSQKRVKAWGDGPLRPEESTHMGKENSGILQR